MNTCILRCVARLSFGEYIRIKKSVCASAPARISLRAICGLPPKEIEPQTFGRRRRIVWGLFWRILTDKKTVIFRLRAPPAESAYRLRVSSALAQTVLSDFYQPCNTSFCTALYCMVLCCVYARVGKGEIGMDKDP